MTPLRESSPGDLSQCSDAKRGWDYDRVVEKEGGKKLIQIELLYVEGEE
jgi:hypothetical protein